LVASVCAIENCSYETQKLSALDANSLAKVFITAMADKMIPVPNRYSRDIGIVINDHILLNKPAKGRTTLLMKYDVTSPF
jgi:arginine deiminase